MAFDTCNPFDAATLLRRLLSRDDHAWRHVVDAYRPCVLAQASRHGLDPDQREDLQQRVWLLLLENAHQIRNPACLPGWLSATARHEALRMARQRRREVSMGAPGDLLPSPRSRSLWSADDRPDIDAELLSAERLTVLDDALTRLPARQRVVLGELMNGETSYQDISVRLGIPVGSIGPTRMRAIQQLRDRISA